MNGISRRLVNVMLIAMLVLLGLSAIEMQRVNDGGVQSPTRENNVNQNDQMMGLEASKGNKEKALGSPQVFSLNGLEESPIPNFIIDNSQEASSIDSQFSLAADSDPNITDIHWQNYTGGVAGDWVTWMQPGGTVMIWFKVKGPVTSGGLIVTVWFGQVQSMSSAYGAMLDAADLNGVAEIGVNESVWFTWIQNLPDEALGNYGWGTGLANAFTLRLYHPEFIGVTPYYEGFHDKKQVGTS